LIFKYAMLLSLLPISALAFDKNFTVNTDRVPHEFNILFSSLRDSLTLPSEKIRLVGQAKELNDNLGAITDKEHILLLMKTEVRKGILEYRFGKIRQMDINTLLIDRLEAKLKKVAPELSRLSLWLWRSILSDLQQRRTSGIITERSFNPQIFDGAKRTEAMRFQRYLHYLIPWLSSMDVLTPVQFNALSKEAAWNVMDGLLERSLLFRRFSPAAFGNTRENLVNIPQKLLELPPEDIKRMQNNQNPLSLKETSALEKSEAQSTVDKLSPEDMSTLSDDVATELDKLEN
jgi:hypothetical protein